MASRSLGTLTLDLIARIGGFQQGMDQASRSMTRTGAAADAASSRITAMQGSFLSLSGAAAKLSASLASAFSLQALYNAAEAYTSLTSRMILVTEGSAQLAAAQKAVFKIAQDAYQPLTATGELYQRLATNQKELKLSGEGVAGVVGTISKTLAISGASAASANAALIQLGQAFASGVLRGEELNSVMEQAPALAQAIAKGMGRTVGELRTLGQAGLLTADSVVKALQAQEKAVADLFNKTAVTIGNSLTALDNSFTQFVGKMDQASGVSAAISSSIVSASKAMDTLSSGSVSTATTLARITSVAETLAYVLGARVALSAGQAVVAFGAATVASVKQAAALVASSAASQLALKAEAETARQTLLTAESRQADALVLMERAKLEVVAAEQKVAADRLRQQSEINNLKSIQTVLAAEVTLEQHRLKAQITEQGRALARNRMAASRLDEVAIIKQIQLAESQLAATTVATSAQIQAAYAGRSAAAAAYSETTIAANAAVQASNAATAAATGASGAMAVAATAGRALIGLLTGPVGMIAMVGLVAASFFSFGGSTDEATKALDAHGLTVAEVTQKYEQLNGAQRRLKLLEWVDEQAEGVDKARDALQRYADAEKVIGLGGGVAEEFRKMVEQVRAGSRDLDSVTEWLKSNINLAPEYEKSLSKIAVQYDASVKRNEDLANILKAVDGENKNAVQSTEALRAAQASSQEQSKAQVAKWEEYIAKLRETRDLFGANKKAQAEYEASKMGLNDKQREEARLVASQIDVMDKYKDAVKEGDKAKQASLRKELEAIYTRQQAMEDAAAAEKKLQEEANKASEEAANKKINDMRRVLEAANRVFNAAANFSSNSSFLTGKNMLLVPQEQPDIKGRGMVLPGAPTPVTSMVPRKTPQQLAAERLAQVDVTTDPKKQKAEQAYRENAGMKVLDQARQQYAVLKEQSTLIGLQKGQMDKLGEAGKALIKWEQELADIKSKKTLTADQKSLLASQEKITAALKLNAALEKENTLRKQAEEDDKAVKEFGNSSRRQLTLDQRGLDTPLLNAYSGDQVKQRYLEMLSIEQGYQDQLEDLRQRHEAKDITDSAYDRETAILNDALAKRLGMQEKYYAQVDQLQQNGTAGALSGFASQAEASMDLYSNMQSVGAQAFNGLTDMIVQWAETGKLNAKEFAATFIQSIGTSLLSYAAAQVAMAGLNAFTAMIGVPFVGPAIAPGAAIAAAAAAGVLMTAVGSSLSGQAHAGMDNIPREGTWLLDGGERVLSPAQNRDLTGYLQRANSAEPAPGSAGPGNVSIHNYGSNQVETRREGNDLQVFIREAKRQIAGDLARGNGDITRALTGGFNVQRKPR
ncbi:phage tail tape measure protein [Pseudomonas ovata]|uniref:phage tail tape measure protein n=1 Tax=Pseudomonas ovata TaxID=1839709 RepID=UPI000D6866A6|nr:phage tail tape measure protein [Pseudomonas ovata]